MLGACASRARFGEKIDSARVWGRAERSLLAPGGFLLLTAHTQAVDPFGLAAFVGRRVEVGELAVEAESGAVLHLGAFARLSRAS